MKRFSYHRPETLSQAVSLLTETPDAQVLAGGTDLVIAMRDHKVEPDAVIDIKRVAEFRPPLGWADDRVVFSASAVMADVAGDERVQACFPGLVEAALVVGSVQIRNRATLVGNICNGSPAADTAPPLLVYGATVVVTGPGGERRVPIGEFIVGPGRVALERGELAAAIEVPVPDGPVGSAYERMTRRKGTDLASVTLCCSVDATGTTRLAYGSVGPRALLVVDASGVLADPNSPPGARDEVLERFFAEASPSPTSLRASPDYRRAMLRVLGRRAVDRAVARLADLGGAV